MLAAATPGPLPDKEQQRLGPVIHCWLIRSLVYTNKKQTKIGVVCLRYIILFQAVNEFHTAVSELIFSSLGQGVWRVDTP